MVRLLLHFYYKTRQEEAFVLWEIYSEAGVFLVAWRARLVRWLSEPQGGRRHRGCLIPSEVFSHPPAWRFCDFAPG